MTPEHSVERLISRVASGRIDVSTEWLISPSSSVGGQMFSRKAGHVKCVNRRADVFRAAN